MSISSPTPSFFHAYAQLADPLKLSNESQRKASLLSEKAQQRAKESKQLRRKAVLERQRARSEIVPLDFSQIPLPKEEEEEIMIEEKPSILNFDNLPRIPQHFINEYQNIESKSPVVKTKTPIPIAFPVKTPVPSLIPSPIPERQRSPERRARSPIRSPTPERNEEDQIRNKIKDSVDRFHKCEEKATEAQNVATKQTTMILLFLTGLFESANQMTGEKLLKVQNLSVNVQAALKSGEFNKFIASIATHPALVQFFQNPLSSFGTTMAQLIMETHQTNIANIKSTTTKAQRRNVNDESKHCTCHECTKEVPVTKPGTPVPWSFDNIPPEQLEHLKRMILAQPPQQFAPYGYYYPQQFSQPFQQQPLAQPFQQQPLAQPFQQPLAAQPFQQQVLAQPSQQQAVQQFQQQVSQPSQQQAVQQVLAQPSQQQAVKQFQQQVSQPSQQQAVQQVLAQPVSSQPLSEPLSQPLPQLLPEALPPKLLSQPIQIPEVVQENPNLLESKQELIHRRVVIDPKLKTPRQRFQPDLPNVSFINTDQFQTMTNAIQNFQPFMEAMGS